MRSLGTLGFLAAFSFYVAWPLYAGYDINSALDTHNVESLAKDLVSSVMEELKRQRQATLEKP